MSLLTEVWHDRLIVTFFFFYFKGAICKKSWSLSLMHNSSYEVVSGFPAHQKPTLWDCRTPPQSIRVDKETQKSSFLTIGTFKNNSFDSSYTHFQDISLLWCNEICLWFAPTLCLTDCYTCGICINNSSAALCGRHQTAQKANFYIMLL